MLIEELIDVVGIDFCEKVLMFCKYFKWLFLIGKNVLFIYIKDLLKGIVVFMKREIIFVVLKEDLEKKVFDRVVKR